MAGARSFPSVWNLANALTLSRLVLAPVAARAILLGHSRQALVLVLVAGLTDLFDGLLARATSTSTNFGRRFDPIADKVLLTGVYFGLAIIGSAPWWLVALILGRDLILLAASAIVLRWTEYRDLHPSRIGKLSTTFQIFTAAAFLGTNAFGGGVIFHVFLHWLVVLTAALTVASGAHYGWRAFQYFRRH